MKVIKSAHKHFSKKSKSIANGHYNQSGYIAARNSHTLDLTQTAQLRKAVKKPKSSE